MEGGRGRKEREERERYGKNMDQISIKTPNPINVVFTSVIVIVIQSL
jgi:hypothetical protein